LPDDAGARGARHDGKRLLTIHALHPAGARETFATPDRYSYLSPTRPGDPGIAPGSGEYERTLDESAGLLWLARRTGGLVAAGPKQSALILSRASAELESYYSIGYRLVPGHEGRPRKLEVTTGNRRHRVRVRDSVVRLSDGQRIRDAVIANLYLPPTEIDGLVVRIEKIAPDGRFRIVHLSVSVPKKALVAIAGRLSFTLFAAAGRELGDAGEVVELNHQVPLSEVDGEMIVVGLALKTRPDSRRISLALRDDASGAVRSAVVVVR
jgi:hypothetical protein